MMNIGNLMKKAQELQDQLEKVQTELQATEITGEAGAGLVKVTLNGKNEARRVEINDSLLTEDKEVLEDLICAAFNDAVRRVQELSQERMSSLTSGLPLPPGVKFPF